MKVRLVARDAFTLKEKRRAIKRLKDRIAHRYKVSVAEVGLQDVVQSAELGICAAANERRHLESLLSKVVDLIRSHPRTQMVDYHLEFFSC